MARRAAERETSYFYRKERETHELIILVVIMASGLPAETATVAESRKMAASIQLLALVDRDVVHL